MTAVSSIAPEDVFLHRTLSCGVEFAADVLPVRGVVALVFRVFAGVGEDPPELTGLSHIVERTLSKGTRRHDGRGLADAFDALGAHWGTASGRESTIVRVLCLPEFVPQVVELVAEMLVQPTFPEDACRVAVELATQERRQLEDDPGDVLRLMIQRLSLGPGLGRNPGGELDTLARITPDHVRAHWGRLFCAGRMQVAAAGPLEADALAEQLDAAFRGFGACGPFGREAVQHEFRAAKEHQHKELEQEYIGITLRGLPRGDPQFAVEQVLIGVLAGGMSGRLFTEVREKQGLVYWVGAWHEQPRGRGIIHLGASTRPERCDRTYETLLREIRRVGEDLTDAETYRARDSHIAQSETEDDLTRSRAAALSDDLFHFGRPIGRAAKMDALRRVEVAEVAAYARRLPLDRLCVATLGPRAL